MDYKMIAQIINNTGEKPVKICMLTNSAYYFISDVIIVNKDEKGLYRLVAEHVGKKLIDKPFSTLRGAKIAFSKLFKHRGWKQDIHAQWSEFYEPEVSWLKSRERLISGRDG